MTSKQPHWKLSRRGFLIGTGVAGAGLAIGYVFGLPRLRLGIADAFENASQPSRVSTKDPSLWFVISPANEILFYSPKVEMGQGIHTALAQIAAEELEVDWAQIKVQNATSRVGPYDGSGTTGSTSVSSLYTPLRTVAATMREMLRAEAARKLGVAASDIRMAHGVAALASNPSRSLTYGQVVQGVTKWEVPKDTPPLKSPTEFHTIGKTFPRVDFADKLQGKAIYGYDMRLPNMLFGAVARPPTIGSTLRRAAPGEAAQQPGVITIVAENGFAGVAATTRLEAWAAVQTMQLEWDQPPPFQQADIDARITVGQGSGIDIQQAGDARTQLQGSSVIQAEYRTPMAAHAHLEAQAALAVVGADSAQIWASTQFPDLVRSEVAKVTGLKNEQIEVIPTYLGGGFGRKSGVEPAVEAARLAKASGRPVHVGWSRTEDFRHGYLRPPTHHILRGRVEAGRILAIEHQQASGHVAFDFLPAAMMQIMGSDFGAWRGARISYAIPNIQVTAWRNTLPVRTGWWRGLGLLANTFAIESFLDELANAAKIDPIQLRLTHLPAGEAGERLRAALTKVADMSAWGSAAPTGRARGVACCIDHGTIAAHVAEVSIEGNQIRVQRFWSVVDAGLAINPDGIIAQTQGSIVMGLSSTLIEELTVRDGQFSASNFDGYPLITIADIPDIEVTVLSTGDIPYGVGEPPLGPVAAAVANAVAALMGKRLRKLPLQMG